MKVIHSIEGRRAICQVPYEGAAYVKTTLVCPGCGSDLVHGRCPEEGRDRIISGAYCSDCGIGRGRLTVLLDTIFGLEEDRRVLNGRCRVY